MPLGDLSYTNRNSGRIFRHTGWSTSLEDSVDLNVWAVGTVDQTVSGDPNRVIVIADVDDRINLYWGFGSILLDSLVPRPSGDRHGMEWKDSNQDMYTTRGPGVKSLRYDGFSSTVLDSIQPIGSGQYRGCTWKRDTDDFILGERDTCKWYELDGYSNTIDDSFSLGHDQHFSCFWDDVDSPETFNWLRFGDTTLRIYKNTGFSSTVEDSLNFGSPGGAPRGCWATNANEVEWVSMVSTTGNAWWGRTQDHKVLIELAELADLLFGAAGVAVVFGLPLRREVCLVQGRDLPAEPAGRDLPADTEGRTVPGPDDSGDRGVDVEDHPSPRTTDVDGQSC